MLVSDIENIVEMCDHDMYCVAFAFSGKEFGPSILYTITGCTKFCDKTDWVVNPFLINYSGSNLEEYVDMECWRATGNILIQY